MTTVTIQVKKLRIADGGFWPKKLASVSFVNRWILDFGLEFGFFNRKACRALRIRRLTKETLASFFGQNPKSQSGMTLFAVMAIMTIFAIGLLAVAPSVQQEVQREKELEAIRRGEEVAEAIRQYVTFYQGNKLPNSIDDLLEGLPQGTKKRQILRASAAIDPLSEDGKWRLIKADIDSLGGFARRVQNYNGGLLPSNPQPTAMFDRYALVLVNSLNTELDSDDEADEDFDLVTENTPFIGVASQSRSKSVIAYYGIENHSKWIFTPLFRGAGRNAAIPIKPRRPNTIIDQ